MVANFSNDCPQGSEMISTSVPGLASSKVSDDGPERLGALGAGDDFDQLEGRGGPRARPQAEPSARRLASQTLVLINDFTLGRCA